ncbi:helix-turn-helix domain-containing protein [Embleya sp. NPDC001921]
MARQPVDGNEEKRIRRLAGARHAPGDWILRARIVTLSWEGLRVPQVAARAGCDAKTVRRWLHRDRYEAGLVDALERLMRRAHTGHSTRAEQRLLSRGAPIRTPPPARSVREEWEQDLGDTVCGEDEDGLDALDDGIDESPLPDTGEDELDSPAPPHPGLGIYDAHEEALKW